MSCIFSSLGKNKVMIKKRVVAKGYGMLVFLLLICWFWGIIKPPKVV